MKNRHLQRLDREIRLRGESVQLIRTVGTGVGVQSKVRANIKGIIKTFGTEQLVGAITQVNYSIIISPTHLRRAGWPGGVVATIPSGTEPNMDPTIPKKSTTDNVSFRGKTTAVTNVDAIYDGDEVVRIELRVLG
jgi:hypothetical protein